MWVLGLVSGFVGTGAEEIAEKRRLENMADLPDLA
jgi:hypothetical protein